MTSKRFWLVASGTKAWIWRNRWYLFPLVVPATPIFLVLFLIAIVLGAFAVMWESILRATFGDEIDEPTTDVKGKT